MDACEQKRWLTWVCCVYRASGAGEPAGDTRPGEEGCGDRGRPRGECRSEQVVVSRSVSCHLYACLSDRLSDCSVCQSVILPDRLLSMPDCLSVCQIICRSDCQSICVILLFYYFILYQYICIMFNVYIDSYIVQHHRISL